MKKAILLALVLAIVSVEVYGAGAGQASAGRESYCAKICRCDNWDGSSLSSWWCGTFPVAVLQGKLAEKARTSPEWHGRSVRYYSINNEKITEGYCYSQCVEHPECFNDNSDFPGPKSQGEGCWNEEMMQFVPSGEDIPCEGELEGCSVKRDLTLKGCYFIGEQNEFVDDWNLADMLLECKEYTSQQECSRGMCISQLRDPSVVPNCRNGEPRDANGCCDADRDGYMDELRSPETCLGTSSWDCDDTDSTNACLGNQNVECSSEGYAGVGFVIADNQLALDDAGLMQIVNPAQVADVSNIKVLRTVRDWWDLFCQSVDGAYGPSCNNGYWGTAQGILHQCLGFPRNLPEINEQGVRDWPITKEHFDILNNPASTADVGGIIYSCKQLLTNPLDQMKAADSYVVSPNIIDWVQTDCSDIEPTPQPTQPPSDSGDIADQPPVPPSPGVCSTTAGVIAAPDIGITLFLGLLLLIALVK